MILYLVFVLKERGNIQRIFTLIVSRSGYHAIFHYLGEKTKPKCHPSMTVLVLAKGKSMQGFKYEQTEWYLSSEYKIKNTKI